MKAKAVCLISHSFLNASRNEASEAAILERAENDGVSAFVLATASVKANPSSKPAGARNDSEGEAHKVREDTVAEAIPEVAKSKDAEASPMPQEEYRADASPVHLLLNSNMLLF